MKNHAENSTIIQGIKKKFNNSGLLINAKGYPISMLAIPCKTDFYADYMEAPCSIIKFSGYLFKLPSVPRGYTLCHVTDECCSMLINRFADGLNPNEVLGLLQETAESVFDWACSL